MFLRVIAGTALMALAPAAAGFAQTPPAPQPTTVPGAVPYVYKTVGRDELRLHVFAPPVRQDDRRPAIVFFFGGGWAQGSVLQFVPQAEALAARGMVAIVTDYRVSSRHATTAFEAMADARSAIRWVRGHARELGIDPNRIAAAGGSAGGHVAVSAALFESFDTPGEDRAIPAAPNALVLFNPVVDTVDFAAPQLEARFDGRGADGSPVHHLREDLPPTLILHGRADRTVTFADVERFCRESRALGNRCELVGYDEAGHGFFNPPNADGRWYRETLEATERFLESLGHLSPAR